MLTDAANIIFTYAKRRCYTMNTKPGGTSFGPPSRTDIDDEDAWDALYEAEGIVISDVRKSKPKSSDWLPEGMQPVLEELPKWTLIAEVLQEIEEEMIRREATVTARKMSLLMCVHVASS